jgi:hypothetical protein
MNPNRDLQRAESRIWIPKIDVYRNGSIVEHDHEREILFSLRMPESVSDISISGAIGIVTMEWRVPGL